MPPEPSLYLRGLLLRGWRETGEREGTVKGKEGERWREGSGPPENFGVAPPMCICALAFASTLIIVVILYRELVAIILLSWCENVRYLGIYLKASIGNTVVCLAKRRLIL